jgi:hypothetical protein
MNCGLRVGLTEDKIDEKFQPVLFVIFFILDN